MNSDYDRLAIALAEQWVRFCYDYANERERGRKFRFGNAPDWSKDQRSEEAKKLDVAFDAFADAFDAKEQAAPRGEEQA